MIDRQPDPTVNITTNRIVIEQGDDVVILDDRQAAELASTLAIAPHVILDPVDDVDEEPTRGNGRGYRGP
jgi:hypothetical protein